MSKASSLLQISTEGLYDYKNPLVQKSITEIVDQYRESLDAQQLATRLSELVKNIYNVNLTVCIEKMRVPAMVRYAQIAPESLPAFRPRSLSDSENAKGRGVAEIQKVTSGWINMKTLKVGGVFAELPVFIFMSDELPNWTNDEIGVAFAHELGHFFDYVNMAAAQFRSFGIVESLVRGIRGADSVEESVEFVKNVSGEYGFKVTEPNQLKLASTDEAIRLKLFKDIQVSNPWFLYGDKSQKQQEYMADEFPAALYGPRVAAVTMSKLISKTSHPAYQSSLLFYGRTAGAIALVLFGAASAMLPVAVFGAMALAVDQASSTQGDTHPDPMVRLQRFRGMLLSDAKNPELTRDQVTQLNNDLELINAEIERLNKTNKSALEFLMDILSPTRRANNSIDAYDNGVTELQNNPLFLRAAQFRQFKD